MTGQEIMWLTGIATTLGVILGAYFAVIQLLKPLIRRIKFWITTWEQFMVDWAGTPARPGVDRVPGVMERLNNMDGELRRNGGKSLKDTVNRIEKRLIEGDKKFEDLYSKVEKLEQEVR